MINNKFEFKIAVKEGTEKVNVPKLSLIHSLVFSLRGRVGRNQSPVL